MCNDSLEYKYIYFPRIFTFGIFFETHLHIKPRFGLNLTQQIARQKGDREGERSLESTLENLINYQAL